MSDFKRARSEEQKEQRMQKIKNAVDELFTEHPYHDITLTTIANKLNLTRAHLYQYISTKEEIFLEICADKRDAYYNALKIAIPKDSGYSVDVIAEVWAGILNSHKDHLRYCDILPTIIETNVSIDRLAAFKKHYYENAYEVSEQICSPLGLSNANAYQLFLNIHFHAVGIDSISKWNPLVAEALAKENIKAPEIDFRANMKEYILMNLNYFLKKC
ncbi:MAG: TetR/AcrR family transcriptional regulator [Clostridia bacterium]|nr:TetR family transcriptional regulator [Lachnospiraceae bacterium]NCC01148.1 TetR/AcrR family transcriptional regulator [Clostridia bacterium]NCD03046.1 TetR/AcrR family transcriptional regulator [Clostridia bacterium]